MGALRDALFKYLFARGQGGANLLRIEDTDRTRYSPEAEAEFIESLAWVGIDYDEGPHTGGPNAPYRQSERKEAGIYQNEIVKLLASGDAYKAFDTPEELEEMREYQQINKQPIGYFGGMWRDATPEQVKEAEAAGKPYVIRQRIPRGQTIVIQDVIRGRVEWDSDTVDDPVLIKADGMPTYHFASMVDDHLMSITHIIRGEEWLSSAPKHACLFDAFGWERPIFVHCPVIKGKDGKKLSKRHGATRVLDYRAAGYIVPALINFIALIGWSPGGDRELLTRQELAEAFSLEHIQPSPGIFDLEKLRWMNGHYLREMAVADLSALLQGYTHSEETLAYWTNYEAEPGDNTNAVEILEGLKILGEALDRDPAYANIAIALEQQRVLTLAEFGPATRFFFEDLPTMDSAAVAKWFKGEDEKALFQTFASQLEAMSGDPSIETCEAMIRDYAASKGLEKLGPVVHPVRVALTGRTFGPGLFELMHALGKDRMIKRFRRALEMF